MRQSIRALGWTINIVMMLIFVFLAASVYPLVHALMEQEIGFGGFQPHPANGGVVLSFYLYVNNTSYYDIPSMNVSTSIRDYRGATISESSSSVPQVAKGSSVEKTHNISISLAEIVSKNLTHLLFQDSNLKMDLSVEFRYAYALAFQISIANTSQPWGAPFYNFSVIDISPYSIGAQLFLNITLGFENHSPLSVDGTVRLEIYNNQENRLGSGAVEVDAPSGSRFEDRISVAINYMQWTGQGYMDIYFDASTFSFGPVRMAYG